MRKEIIILPYFGRMNAFLCIVRKETHYLRKSMAKSYIQLIKAAAARVRDSKLQKLGTKETGAALDDLAAGLGLHSRGEAIVFAAFFDRSCSGRNSDMEDLASYFDCTQLDVMEYLPAITSLQDRGLIVQSNPDESRRVEKSYIVSNYVMDCLLDGRIPDSRPVQMLRKDFDRYDFCKAVGLRLEDSDVSCEELLQQAQSMERDYSEMSFVAAVTKAVPELRHRVLFYDICKDFLESDMKMSDIDMTLKDMYSVFSLRFQEAAALRGGTHPLVQAGLVELASDDDYVQLCDKGKELLLEDDFKTYSGKYNNLDRYKFASALRNYIRSNDFDANKDTSESRLSMFVYRTERLNSSLGFINNVKDILDSEVDRALFYLLCNDCAKDGGGLAIPYVLGKLYSPRFRRACLKKLKEDTHILQQTGLAEMTTSTSLFGESTVLSLTDKGKKLFFEEDAELFIDKVDDKCRIKASDITQKHLFFSDEQRGQLSLVENALEENNYRSLVSRLEAKGLMKGLAVLLYGAPGTGKTETVMQWARKSGRDIIHVDISASKSMWYGESEKIIKKIFSDYRKACRNASLKPILLFNEADAIFSKRRDIGRGNGSIDQTENAIQNIILEEMEKLEGILIATTNLEGNLDGAFERRFLFKIRYEKPSVQAKTNIWKDKLPSLSDCEAESLASNFDFSGGEIDNIVRKATMEEVISGKVPSLADIVSLCNHERLSCDRRAKIGF